MTYLRKIGPAEFLTTGSLPFHQSISTGMLSVVIASRFQRKPDGGLWLSDAVASIHNQELLGMRPLEIIVGLDAGSVIPTDAALLPVTYANADPQYMPSQANSLNAALKIASGDILGFLDDDDQWFPNRLTHGLYDLQFADIVSSSALNHDATGKRLGTSNHYSIPSGWLMRRQTQIELGWLDLNIRHYTDTEYVGRMNRAGLLRIMQVPQEPITQINNLTDALQLFLKLAPLGSALHSIAVSADLVYKVSHDNNMTTESINNDAGNAAKQMALIIERYGNHPY